MLNCNYIFSRYFDTGIFVLLTLFILVLLIVLYIKKYPKRWYDYVGMGLLLVGGFPNLVSRLRDGCVVDNISLFNILYLNVWDILVVGGIIILLGGMIYESKSPNN